jgi:hypothetical protein
MKANKSRSSIDNSFLGGPGLPDVPPLVGSAILFSFLPDGIYAARVKGMTFRQPLYAHPNAAQRPVLFDGQQHVLRAGGVEAAIGREPWGDAQFINTQRGDHEPLQR